MVRLIVPNKLINAIQPNNNNLNINNLYFDLIKKMNTKKIEKTEKLLQILVDVQSYEAEIKQAENTIKMMHGEWTNSIEGRKGRILVCKELIINLQKEYKDILKEMLKDTN